MESEAERRRLAALSSAAACGFGSAALAVAALRGPVLGCFGVVVMGLERSNLTMPRDE